MQVSEITAILRSVAIFAHTPEVVLQELASGMKECHFNATEIIIQKGDLGSCMYLIASGLTKVHDGIHTLLELGPGNMIGELAILDTEPRSASVTALEPTVAFQLNQDDFYHIVGNRPEVLQGLIRTLVQRMRAQNDIIISSLKQREQDLSRLVDERTAELREANEQLMSIYGEIKLRNNQLEEANHAISIKQMELENAYEEINITLERVNQQNIEITKQKTLLENQQAMLVQSERMAAIGMLAPIVAHEINSPLGVLNAALQNITALVPQAFTHLTHFADQINAGNKSDFIQIVDRALTETPNLTTREERRFIREVEDQLIEVNLPDTEDAAEKLVKIGIIENTASLVTLIKAMPADASAQVIEVLYSVGLVRKQMTTMRTAIERAQKIIAALNNYVWKRNEADDPIETDVLETVTTVLTLYEYHITQGIEIVLELEDHLPHVMGFPDQLSQVWTNLLLNAQHAAKNQTDRAGKIIVRVRQEGKDIAVSIIDNGVGIPPEMRDKVFLPLFTTKPKGEGTGQGLSISKGIIEKHHGTIYFDSVPGETTFIVRLPIKSEE